MNLLVTGGCGFIGSHFVNMAFERYDATIVNLDAMYYCASETNVCDQVRSSKQYIFIRGNVCSSDLVTHVLQTHNITHIVHFAAQSHVQNSFDDSLQFTKDNVVGTHTLLECARKYGKIKRFVHVSTDEVYGESMLEAEEEHKNEQSILCPTNPYAATKAAAELLAQAYHHSFGLPIIITRGNNVYGPNQYPEKLIPRFIKLLREDKPVTIQGDGLATRAFMHVDDAARAFMSVLDNGIIGEIYNIGCDDGSERTVIDVAKTLIRRLKPGDEPDKWIEYVDDRPFNDKRYYISNAKLTGLGWTQTVGWEEGLDTCIGDMSIFGEWILDVERIRRAFACNKPFPHAVIDDFLNPEIANTVHADYPSSPSDKWHHYQNPLEIKYAFNDIGRLKPSIQRVFDCLGSPAFVDRMQQITQLPTLEMDPYLHGAGLHMMPRNGRLHLHLDYEKHPRMMMKQRRLNIILFLSKDWKPQWNGATELWDKDLQSHVDVQVRFNRAILFQTNEVSWHGVPRTITCPETMWRRSLAYYYVSPLHSKSDRSKIGASASGYREKATFIPTPDVPEQRDRYGSLYSIRPHRRIGPADLQTHCPDWDETQN